jgi:hypothetical protein
VQLILASKLRLKERAIAVAAQWHPIILKLNSCLSPYNNYCSDDKRWRWQGETLKTQEKQKTIVNRINVSDNYVFTAKAKIVGAIPPREGEAISRALGCGFHTLRR